MVEDINSCDGALWHIEQKEDEIGVESTIYKYKDKNVEPDELGYKYHILTYRGDDADSAEVFSAYIGDVKFFIDNHAKAGYNGMIVKNKAIPKRDVREMFRKILFNRQFPEKAINAAIRKV